MDTYRLEQQKAVATGYPEGSGKRPAFRVLAGSTAMRDSSPNVNLWFFEKDYVFSSASAAGDVINDGNLSAPQYWVNVTTGESLKDRLLRVP